MSIFDRFSKAWNAFRGRDPTKSSGVYEYSTSYRPDRHYLRRGTERTIVTSIINRIGIDVAAINIVHARLDDRKRFIGEMESGLNECLNLSANIDQTGRAFRQDAAMSLCSEGVIAIVPVVTDKNPDNGSYDILAMRVGRVAQWRPMEVNVDLYNARTGKHEQIWLPKDTVAIVENPLYATMNEPNSTLQRLIRKLSMLDAVDEQSSAGKLDLIIQLPYLVRGEARKQQAENRRKELEMQLKGSKYGIAYTDGTERITQLNRSLENNLLSQIEFLTSMLYSQLGITKEVMDGTASEAVMLNYYNRTIEPILSAITDEMKRKFLTKTARSQRQTILFFRDPFRLAPISSIADIADRFTRNEIMSSNEVRQVLGLPPSDQPSADELRNKNITPTGYPANEYADPAGEEYTDEYSEEGYPEDEGAYEEEIPEDEDY